ncbi:MAG: tRNA lysidine(34) synthetase TilS [Bacillota bacterium]
MEAYISKHRLVKNNDTVIVAVSGGPDSLCLLHVLYKMRNNYNLKLVVAHLNHCLRPEAKDEARGVEELARSFADGFETKEVDIKTYKKANQLSEEEAGRRARYDFFYEIAKKYDAAVIALGHHFDDQAETVLLNIIRGTGPDGLAGILPARSMGKVKLIRPLLSLRRSEIEEYCWSNKLKPFSDRSNLQTGYTRNKLRLELIPYLEQHFNPRIRESLYSLSELARYDRYFLRYLSEKKFKELALFSSGRISLDLDRLLKLPQAIRGRILKLALAKFISGKKLTRLHVEQVNSLLEHYKVNGRASLPNNVEVFFARKALIIQYNSKKQTESFDERSLSIPGKVYLPGGKVITARIDDVENLSWPPLPCQAYLDLDQVPGNSLKVRSRWAGARFWPQGAAGSKKLKDFLIDQKIPGWKRDSLPLVTAENEILWVVGVRIAHPYRITGSTKRVLLLELKVLKRPKRLN